MPEKKFIPYYRSQAPKEKVYVPYLGHISGKEAGQTGSSSEKTFIPYNLYEPPHFPKREPKLPTFKGEC